jgi:tetratricopeptide (TPR) repeat protein
MLMQYFLLFIILVIFLVLITRPFTVLFHELGHAIPAILLTGKRVAVYIGSYGDPAKSLRLTLGLLDIWFKYNPFLWRQGLCIPNTENCSINKQILWIVCGPIASLILALIACYCSFAYDLHGALKLSLIVFLSSAIFDLFINIIPDNTPVKLHDGSIAYNDGYNLRKLLGYKKFPNEYLIAVKQFNYMEYERALQLFEKFLNQKIIHEDIYRLSIASAINIRKFEKALEYHLELSSASELNSDDYCNLGLIKGYLNKHEESYEAFEKSLSLNSKNIHTLNNRGYFLNVQGRYDEAIQDFDFAILIDPDFIYPYINRGFAYVKTGKFEKGLDDLEYALKIEPDNSYACRNLGVYYMDKGNKSEALNCFEKAKNFDKYTHLIDEYILSVKSSL